VGPFEWALNQLVDHELDSKALDDRFCNDQTGAPAYDPRTLIKIVLLGHSRCMISSRKIERACEQNTVFMAIGGGARPSYGQIAKFVREVGQDIAPLFAQVLATCDRLGLIGKAMFAINEHWCRRRVDQLRKEAQATRDFINIKQPRLNVKGEEIKSNMTDTDSAKMLNSKVAIQGYAAQAAVASQSQIIVAADVICSGSEQSMLMPMVDQANPFLEPHTLITADAGYRSDANVQALHDRGIPALIADTMMRQRDQRFRDAARFRVPMFHDKRANKNHKGQTPLSEFTFVDEQTALCPQGKTMHGLGTIYTTERGLPFRRYEAQAQDCATCSNKAKCKRNPDGNRCRQIAIYLSKPIDDNSASELMKQAIDSERGRRLYSQRVGTVEPVLANLRHHKSMNRFTVRGKTKATAQWRMYCLVHNIEKIAQHLR
jgi:Transposase DDE domain/Transposase domain (DUF772)